MRNLLCIIALALAACMTSGDVYAGTKCTISGTIGGSTGGGASGTITISCGI